MRRLLLSIAAAGLTLTWAAAAWAVTGTITAQTEQGTAEGGASVSMVVVHKSDVQNIDPHKPVPHKYVVTTGHVKGRTDATGKTEFTYDEKKTNSNDDIALFVLHEKGGGIRFATQPLPATGGVLTFVPPQNFATGTPTTPGGPIAPFQGLLGGVHPGMSGPYGGFGLGVTDIHANTTEISVFGDVTDQFSPRDTTLTPNGTVGFDFSPTGGNIVIGPFVSVLGFNGQAVNHFSGGDTYTIRNNVTAVLGGRFGFFLPPSTFFPLDNSMIYLRGGATFTDQAFIFDFPGSPKTTVDKTVVGGMFGVGGKKLLNDNVMIADHRSSLWFFLEYNAFLNPATNVPPTMVTPFSTLRNSDFWAQGVNFGLELHY